MYSIKAKRKAISVISALAVILPLVSCSTTQRRGVDVTNCTIDSPTDILCLDSRGMREVRSVKDSINYICRPPDDDAKLKKAALEE